MVTFGLQIPWFSWPGSPGNHRATLRDIALAAEDAGFTSLWVMDHFFQLPGIGDITDDMHEAYTTLGYLAGVTERITLGALVTGITYRHPGLLIKEVSTLDVLSGGRAWFGVGAAWFEEEHLALGVSFPSTTERFERLEEGLQIAKQMWSDDDGAFNGRHNALAATICSPQPLQKPHPPIMVGGNGEQKTLRLVARYADACNLVYLEPEAIPAKLDVLRRHCDAVGRDFDAIRKTRLGPITPDADLVSHVGALVETGLEHLIFNTPDPHSLLTIKRFGAEVVPAFS